MRALFFIYFQVKSWEFYIRFNSHGHIGTGPQHVSLVAVEKHSEVSVFI